MKENKPTLSDKIAKLFMSSRIVLIILVCVVIGGIIGYFIFSEINKVAQEESATAMEKVIDDYMKDYRAETDEVLKEELRIKIIDTFSKIEESYSGQYAAQKSLFLKGNLHFDSKELDLAYECYVELSEKYSESVFAEEALLTAGICQEELGNIDIAIEHYNKFKTKYRDSYLVPRIIFSLGRLYEEKEDYVSAKENYDILKTDYRNTNWTRYAINRIIYLTVEGKI